TNLQKAFEVDPTHPQTAYDLAVLYRDDGSPSRALEVMNQSLKTTMSSKGQGLMTNFILNNVQLRGNLYLNAEKFVEARRDYEFYMRYIDNDPEVLINLSVAQRESGEPKKAIETLAKLPEIQKKSGVFYVNLGQAYAKDGQLDRAIETYQQGLQFDPEYSELHFNLGLAYAKKGMKAEGEQAMRKGILLRTQPRKQPVDPHAFLK
ncbi:MAG: tetratricopeptide repeat protein, partial [Desulfobulbaceae bacterium]|nr:tetratricopeptide repeat protein [Desulfobulbaceae bacterium]